MISNIEMPWIGWGGCDVLELREIGDISRVIRRPGLHWVRCRACGTKTYLNEMPLDKSKCPECGYDGDARHKWSKRK